MSEASDNVANFAVSSKGVVTNVPPLPAGVTWVDPTVTVAEPMDLALNFSSSEGKFSLPPVDTATLPSWAVLSAGYNAYSFSIVLMVGKNLQGFTFTIKGDFGVVNEPSIAIDPPGLIPEE